MGEEEEGVGGSEEGGEDVYGCEFGVKVRVCVALRGE